jgi:hypothetical protein
MGHSENIIAGNFSRIINIQMGLLVCRASSAFGWFVWTVS